MSIFSRCMTAVCAAFAVVVLTGVGTSAGPTSHGSVRETFLYAFPSIASGAHPNGVLLRDRIGNLYGTTYTGGAANAGTIFKLSRTGHGFAQSVLYNFGASQYDGVNPIGGLIADPWGALYGVTSYGGRGGGGTVFKLTPRAGGYTESVIYSFQSSFGCSISTDACIPVAGLVFDKTGSLFGTTQYGGGAGEGTIYKLTRTSAGYTESIVLSFGLYGDIGYALTSPVLERDGSLYTTTWYGGNTGGCMGCGGGAVVKLTPAGTGYVASALYRFGSRANDGSKPNGIIADRAGALYGTTLEGGTMRAGTVFKLTPNATGYTQSILYNFKGGWDGAGPGARLILDAAGSLYGTTTLGGSASGAGFGTVFKIAATANGYVETILHRFNARGDGANPGGTLIGESSNSAYGTASNGGVGFGAIFKLEECR